MNFSHKIAQGGEPASAHTQTHQELQDQRYAIQEGKPVTKALVADKSWPHLIAGG